jgi:peptidoglycan/LPS O-acetylase OafA/YrhL
MAVLLVMFNHGGGDIWPGLARKGWVGVDLFFVLSGFLISGLLFGEYKSHGSINFGRFFIRRGLKIYPAFYAFLFLSQAVAYIAFRSTAPLAHYLPELFFVQNYWHGIWDHTWSLGVEEHFYIFLPLLLLCLLRFSSEQRDPFRILPRLFVTVAILCVFFRAISVCFAPPNYHMAYTASHNRMDALFFGVLLGYYYHFRPEILKHLMHGWRNCSIIGLGSFSLLFVTYLLPRDSSLFSTFGFTCVYLGFGGILLLSLYLQGILRGNAARYLGLMGSAAASVGMYSYSIYLWHGPVAAWFPGLVRRVLHVSFGANERFAVFVIGSLIVGIAMSKMIEYPILRLRDRIFPAQESATIRASDVAHKEATTAPNIPAKPSSA